MQRSCGAGGNVVGLEQLLEAGNGGQLGRHIGNGSRFKGKSLWAYNVYNDSYQNHRIYIVTFRINQVYITMI